MHTITAMYDQDYYSDKYRGYQGQQQLIKEMRMMWIKKREFSSQEKAEKKNLSEGFYLFGGVDPKGNLKNDIFLIEPFYFENQKVLSLATGEYAVHPYINLMQQRIVDFKGKPPCPRIQHSATSFKNWDNHFFLVIYGGRNDSIYQNVQNVALNDLCMFNVNTREWIAIGIYGQMPCSRWSCTISSNGFSRGNDGFLILGGVNLKNYCKTKLY